MGWFRAKRPSGRLFLTRADGRSLRRELAPGLLENFAEQVLKDGDHSVLLEWTQAGQAGSPAVLACWPPDLPIPHRALLGGGDKVSGPWLEVSFERGVSLQDVADDLALRLAGQSLPDPVEAEELPEAEPAPQALPVPPPVVILPPPRPSAPAVVVPKPAPESARIPEPTPKPEPKPEVLAPGARIAPEREGTLRERPEDVFGIWGDAHPDDLDGDSPALRGEDLPWLCPGDRLYSPRRGGCRLLALEDEGGRWLIRDERGRELRVTSAELTAEFSFEDDEPRV